MTRDFEKLAWKYETRRAQLRAAHPGMAMWRKVATDELWIGNPPNYAAGNYTPAWTAGYWRELYEKA